MRKILNFKEGNNTNKVKKMKIIIQKIVDFGIPINLIARKVNKDGSTIGKWLRGQTNISKELEEQLEKLVIQMNKEWQEIFK